MKGGAYDFLQKPVDPEQLARRAPARARAPRAREGGPGASVGARPRDRARDPRRHARPPSRACAPSIQQVAATETTVLITGESGVGKELAAAEIHRRSPRHGRNLVRVNCAAIPDSLFESEFFGHRRGAFSGAIADRVGRFQEAEGGTIVLDEIGSLKPEMQAKLLRILESGEFQVVGESRTRVADVRVIGVSNEDLAARVRDGTLPRRSLLPAQRVPDRGAAAARSVRRTSARSARSSSSGCAGAARPGDPPPRARARSRLQSSSRTGGRATSASSRT